MRDDPLDKLIDKVPMPVPAPGPKPKHKQWKSKTPLTDPTERVTRAVKFSASQWELVKDASKRIGFAQYINNLIRCDIEQNGQQWPSDLRRNNRRPNK